MGTLWELGLPRVCRNILDLHDRAYYETYRRFSGFPGFVGLIELVVSAYITLMNFLFEGIHPPNTGCISH